MLLSTNRPWCIYWPTLLDATTITALPAGRFSPIETRSPPHHSSAMEIHRPYSPETAAFVSSSLEAWNKFFLSDGDSQSDVDFIRQDPVASEDPDSLTEESVDELLLSVLPTPSMPPRSDQTYDKLASVMGASYLELAEIVGLRVLFCIHTVDSRRTTGRLALRSYRRGGIQAPARNDPYGILPSLGRFRSLVRFQQQTFKSPLGQKGGGDARRGGLRWRCGLRGPI